MILRNSYYYFKSAISEKDCEKIIKMGEEEMKKSIKKFGKNSILATTNGETQKNGQNSGKISIDDMDITDVKEKGIETKDLYIRDTKISWLTDSFIFNLLFPFVEQANRFAGWNFDWDCTEPHQYTKYDVNQFYGWHTDNNDPYVYVDKNNSNDFKNMQHINKSRLVNNPLYHGKIRKLSVTLNLSKPTDYEGGNLNFDFGHLVTPRYYTCTEIRPRGSIIVFPSHIYHQVTPVTKGTRRSLVMWCCGYPFK